jgi:predicted MFS family arabinose efflux permease
MAPEQPMQRQTGPRLPSTILWMSVVGGFIAANSHYAAPLLPEMAKAFGAAPTRLALLPAATQLGLALGLIIVVPLSDMVERRRLLLTMLLLLAVAAGLESAAMNLAMLFACAVALGVGCAGAQILTPYAALLAPPRREGEASSLVLSGILCGAFVSKVIAGVVGASWGWRAPFLLSSLVMLASAVLMRRRLPPSVPEGRTSYFGLLASLGRLVMRTPSLRRHALNGAMTCGCMTAFWATYALQLSRAFDYGPTVAGLFGLVGMAGTLGALFAGRQVDGGMFGRISLAASTIMAAGFVCLWAGAANLPLFILGVLAIDAGAGLSHAANQSAAFTIDPAARGRINSVYMASYFLGGAVSTSVGAALYGLWGWSGICAQGVVLSGAMLVLQLIAPIRPGLAAGPARGLAAPPVA